MNIHSLARTTPHSRVLLVQRIRRDGWQPAEAAEAAGISSRTAYKWLSRYRQGGASALRDRSSRPHRIPFQLEPKRVELVLQLRHCRMSGPHIARQLHMPTSTVARVLQRAGLSRLKNLEPPEPARRYEYRRPGGLIHLDVKKLGRIGRVGHRIHGDRRKRSRGVGWEFVHVCIDDATRLAYVETLPDERALSAVGFLRRAAAWFRGQGVHLRRVMTDNGSCYVSYLFRDVCRELGIRHIRTRPYRPRTNGKAERFIQTMLRECLYSRPYSDSNHRCQALRAWVRYYNGRRPHGGLAGYPPMSRLRRAL